MTYATRLDDQLRRRLGASGYGRPGFAERYDRFRPRPPAALLELLPPLASVERPSLVVDLGSGTGLSTRAWADRAEEVIGVEPSKVMRNFAEQVGGAANVRYVDATSYDTGLADGCADLVTSAQSLQWMRPEQVFPEIGRILRRGGVFCAYEYFALQTPLWQPEASFEFARQQKHKLREELGLNASVENWPVSRERLEQSGIFRQTRELALHSVEQGDGDRLLGFALSEGSMRTLLEAGVSEEDVGLDRLRRAAAEMPNEIPWWISYRAWIGLK